MTFLSILPRIALALAVSLPAAPAVAKTRAATTLAVIAGDNQSVIPDRQNASVFNPIQVRVTGAGKLRAGTRVHFSAAPPAINMACAISSGRTPTEADVPIKNGVATLNLLRGHKSVSCAGGTGTVIVTATLGPASAQATEKAAHQYLLIVSPTSQSMPCGALSCTCVSISLSFMLLDGGKPAPDTAINFEDNGAGMPLSASPLTTVANGTAQLSYIITATSPDSVILRGTATDPNGGKAGYSATCSYGVARP